MTRIAIIGGTGLNDLHGLRIEREAVVDTRWGHPSSPLRFGRLSGSRDAEVVFLSRHGPGHTVAPHKVNYRANIWALREASVDAVIAVAAVGGITAELANSMVVVPDQIIDYTWSRQQTFFEDEGDAVVHVDFTEPYDRALRERLIVAAERTGVPYRDRGTYGATQGPRLESTAEIDRLERDGCTIVGMTGMPEAALAREAELAYAHLAVVANPAAGRGDGAITMEEIGRQLETGMGHVRAVLGEVLGD